MTTLEHQGDQLTPAQQAANRDLWIEALLSGNFIQTTTYLHDTKGYCCLGVLSQVSGLATWEQDRGGNGKLVYAAVTEEDEHEATVLPQSIMEWAGMETATGEHLDPDGNPDSLAGMNDGNIDFPAIAERIRWMFGPEGNQTPNNPE